MWYSGVADPPVLAVEDASIQSWFTPLRSAEATEGWSIEVETPDAERPPAWDAEDAALEERIAGEQRALLDLLRRRRSRSHPPGVLSGLVRRDRRFIDAVELEFSHQAAVYAASGDHRTQGASSPIAWMRESCHMTARDSIGAVCVGEQADSLPASMASLQAGRIGMPQLTVLARTAAQLERHPGAFDESVLLPRAETRSLVNLIKDCDHIRHAADADAYRDRERSERERRCVHIVRASDGWYRLHGELDPVGGEILSKAVAALAQPVNRHDPRLIGQRQADGVVELAEIYIGESPARVATVSREAGGAGSDRAAFRVRPRRPVTQLVVTATLDTITGAPGAPGGEVEGKFVVSAETARFLGCCASVSRVLFDSKSALIDVGRSRRVPGAPQRRGMLARAPGCAWPERCNVVDRRRLIPHHVLHWGSGGLSEDPNLEPLCAKHHYDVHHGWTLVRGAGGTLIAVPPAPVVRSRMLALAVAGIREGGDEVRTDGGVPEGRPPEPG